jgi:hypothetical protein
VKPVDFTVEAATGIATSRTEDKSGKIQVESHHIDVSDDLANGFVGTLLLNLRQNAAPFRIHPELGGIVGVIARLIGLKPKDVMVWVLDGQEPAVMRIVGQLGGYGHLVSSDLEGISFEK